MAAKYTLPVFNLSVNIWRNGRLYTDPPDVVTVGNLALGRRVSGSKLQDNTTNPSDGGMWLLLPKATDIRDSKALSGEDMVEVPAGSGRLYTSKWVDDCGKGFLNEHRFSVIFALPPWGVPFPGPPMPPPPPPGPLPYFAAHDYSAPPDSVVFTVSGVGRIHVWVWQVAFSAVPPSVVSANSGALTPLASAGPLVGADGQAGTLFLFSYVPIGTNDTLVITPVAANPAYAWWVLGEGGTTDDAQNALVANYPTNSSGMAVTITGPSNDIAEGAFMYDPAYDVPAIINAFASSPPPITSLLTQAGTFWGFGFGTVNTALPPPSVSFDLQTTTIGAWLCLAATSF